MQPPPGSQTFYRGSDRMIGGVCSGLAEGFHVEVLWVRLAFVVLTFLNGAGLLLYVVLWFLMPDRAGYRPPGESVFASMGTDLKRAWADLRTQISGRPATPPTATPTAAAPPPATSSSAPQAATRQPSFILGAILIVIGIAFLVANLNLVNWSIIWPAALVALGVALLVRNVEKRSDK